MSSQRRIQTEILGHVLLITIDRPDKRNAFDLQALGELAAAYTELERNDALRVGCVVSSGEHFSAGLDLANVGPAVAEQGPAALSGGADVDPFGLWGPAVSKPVVLALNGIAFTLSIELALAADIRIAADDLRARQMEIARGILPFGGATFRAPEQLGWANAMRWNLTGEEFGAEEALRIGLVSEVVPAPSHVDRAKEIAARVAEQAPLGVGATLANARVYRSEGFASAKRHLREALSRVMASDDAAEGLASFRERRKAEFKGR